MLLYYLDEGSSKMMQRQMIFGIATRIDMLNFITENQAQEGSA